MSRTELIARRAELERDVRSCVFGPQPSGEHAGYAFDEMIAQMEREIDAIDAELADARSDLVTPVPGPRTP